MESDANAKAAAGFGRLFEIVRRLRDPDGCPWDRAQTAYSLRGNLIEEAYEAISAIEEGDEENLREELGDLLLVLTMIAYIRQQEGSFQVTEVLEHIAAKLVRRHPHVFGGPRKDTPAEVVEQWDHIKENLEGKKAKNSVLDRVPRTLPPLERAYEIQNKVAKVGFDWDAVGPVWDKLAEEIGELREAQAKGDPRRVEAEFGDLLFTVVNLGRLMELDPSLALNATNQKFIGRFQELERRLAAQGLAPKQAGLAQMDAIWNQIKAEDQSSRSK
jgi:tetrapyrrole methylase family protein/MazG family protein